MVVWPKQILTLYFADRELDLSCGGDEEGCTFWIWSVTVAVWRLKSCVMEPEGSKLLISQQQWIPHVDDRAQEITYPVALLLT